MQKLIEAILFMKGEPVTHKELGLLTKATPEELESALAELGANLSERGIRLVRKDDEVTLATSPEFSQFFADAAREEQSKDLGKAGLETLAIVLYQAPVSKNKIEYIRGVNCSFVLRSLLIRGLVERIQNPEDQRSYLYRGTFDALAHLGVTAVSELPEYEELQKQVTVVLADDAEMESVPHEDESHEAE